MVRVDARLSALLRDVVGTTAATIEVEGETVRDFVNALVDKFGPKFRERVIDERTGTLRRFINVFVDGKDIRTLQG